MSKSENHAALAAEWDAWVAKCNEGGAVTPDQLTLQERVRRFNLGTPTALHVGTHELVNDLWRELEMSRQPADANQSRPVRQHSGDQSAHTPGPWEAVCRQAEYPGRPFEWSVLCGGPDYDHDNVAVYGEHTEGNARLIAAAPDMLAALDLAATTIKEMDGGIIGQENGWESEELFQVWLIVRAAIAKATSA